MVYYRTSTCFITKRGKRILILDSFKNGSLVTVGNRAGALRQNAAANTELAATK